MRDIFDKSLWCIFGIGVSICSLVPSAAEDSHDPRWYICIQYSYTSFTRVPPFVDYILLKKK